jgi:hypothetical protein
MPGHDGGRAGRVAAWRSRYWQRLRDAKTDLDRLGAALDHFRVAVTKCAGPEQRKEIVTEAVADLAGQAEELLTHFETRGRKNP